jgi:hypothetical protein
LLIDAGVPHHPEVGSPDPKKPAVWVFEFPMKSPEGALLKDDMTALDQLENWLAFKRFWTEHNPSVTIYVGPNEWLQVGAWVKRHWNEIGGISFLPRSDHVYELAPLEAITAEEYENRVASFPDIPWEKLRRYEAEDMTTSSQELACVAGACAI